MKENYVRNNRVKRGVPLDSAIFLQVLQHQQTLFTKEKIKEVWSLQNVCHMEKSYLNQIPKMSALGQQKHLRWTVYNLALSFFYKFSGLFAILFVSNDLGTYADRFYKAN